MFRWARARTEGPLLTGASDVTPIYEYVSSEDIEAAVNIEVEGFPPDEAGSVESFTYRQKNAPELFLGAYLPKASPSGKATLVGYVNATLTPDPSLTHHSMSAHTPLAAGGASICVHSVCVDLAHRRKGIALALLKEYIQRVKEHNAQEDSKGDSDGRTLPEKWGKYARILLITHENLIPFYEKAGFELLGESAVVHGSQKWFEMRLVL